VSGDVQRYLVIGQIALTLIASVVAVIGFSVIPDHASVPIHAGFRGFDGFTTKARGLVTLALLPPLVCAILLLGAWARGNARPIVGAVGFLALVVLLIFNIQAVRYAMRVGP
jgi:hypothetical protein